MLPRIPAHLAIICSPTLLEHVARLCRAIEQAYVLYSICSGRNAVPVDLSFVWRES